MVSLSLCEAEFCDVPHGAVSQAGLHFIMVRGDLCNAAFAGELGDVVTRVLPHGIYDTLDETQVRETLSQVRTYNSEVLATLQREPALPPKSQDWCR